MNKIEYIATTVVLLITSIISSAQVAVGQWQDHFSYNNGKQLIVVDKTAYLISECGILKYDSESNEIERFNKFNVLSDITQQELPTTKRQKA